MKKNKDKYIAIFSGYILPHLGGIERYVNNLVREFNKMSYRVILVTSNYSDLANYEEYNDNLIIRLPVYNMFKNRYPILKNNKKSKELVNKLNNYNIISIIVNTRFHLTSHVGAKYGKKHNIPVYLIEHGSKYVTLDNKFIDFFANRYEDFLTWRIKNKIAGFYGVSNACADWLKHFKIVSSGTWYNSIDTNQKKVSHKKHKGINFMYAGRLIKQKGVENILDAFTKLEKSFNNIHLFVAGDGPELEKYKSKYSSNNILFLGKLNYEELSKYYAQTDIFLYPPLWPEGLPTSILEAGLYKCAVIGTNQGGIREIIKDGFNGAIVDTTADALYDKMNELMTNQKMIYTYGNNLFDDINSNFSWSVTAKKVLKDMGVDVNEG